MSSEHPKRVYEPLRVNSLHARSTSGLVWNKLTSFLRVLSCHPPPDTGLVPGTISGHPLHFPSTHPNMASVPTTPLVSRDSCAAPNKWALFYLSLAWQSLSLEIPYAPHTLLVQNWAHFFFIKPSMGFQSQKCLNRNNGYSGTMMEGVIRYLYVLWKLWVTIFPLITITGFP